MKKIMAYLLIASVLMPAFGQERAFLTKLQVEELAIRKKWIHIRTTDTNQVSWDIRSGGQIFANNFTSGSREAGLWSINDQGQLCVKWRSSSPDRCVGLLKQTLQMVDAKDLRGIYADLAIE